LTLKNMEKPDPWMKIAIKSLLPKAIPHIQKDQSKLFYDGKYNQILWSIEKKGLKPEEFFLKENQHQIKYTQPNFEIEWEEANRYPEFKKMGKDNWIKIAKQGKSVLYNSVKDILGNIDLNFKGLEEPKKERFQAAFKKGVIEMPIVVKFNEKDYDLVAGNTRLSGLVNNGINPKIWIVDISNLDEMLNYPNWLRNQAQTPQNNPDGEHRFYLPKKKKIKEFAMGMMSPVEKARHNRNMHRLMKILNKHQVHYFPYPNIPNTLVRKLYERILDKMDKKFNENK